MVTVRPNALSSITRYTHLRYKYSTYVKYCNTRYCFYGRVMVKLAWVAIAAATATALQRKWTFSLDYVESARLFENIGTVNDGMNTLTITPLWTNHKRHRYKLKQGEIKFNDITFAYDPTNHYSIISISLSKPRKGWVNRSFWCRKIYDC